MANATELGSLTDFRTAAAAASSPASPECSPAWIAFTSTPASADVVDGAVEADEEAALVDDETVYTSWQNVFASALGVALGPDEQLAAPKASDPASTAPAIKRRDRPSAFTEQIITRRGEPRSPIAHLPAFWDRVAPRVMSRQVVIRSGHELLPAVYVVGGASERGVAHDVDG